MLEEQSKGQLHFAREQKPFGPAQIETKRKYMQTTNKYVTTNKSFWASPAEIKANKGLL